MKAPRHPRFRKQHKARIGKTVSNQSIPCLGRFGIRAVSATRIKASTLEAVRRVITRTLKRTGQVWVRPHTNVSVSAKPLEMRMGKGKGSVSYWAYRVKIGELLYEIDGVSHALARQAEKAATSRLPIKTRFVAL